MGVPSRRLPRSLRQQAARLGWSTTDLFGVVRSLNGRGKPTSLVGQRIGLALLIRGGNVVEITADRATIRYASGSELIYLRQSDRFHGVVPFWDLIK